MNHSRSYGIVIGLGVALGLLGFRELLSQQPPRPPTAARGNLFQHVVAADLTPEQQEVLRQLRTDDPSAGEVKIVRLNVGLAATADTLDVNLVPSEVPFVLSTQRREGRDAADYTWFGADSEGKGSAVLVVQEGQVTGTIRADQKLFRVRPLGGGLHAVIEVDTTKLPPEHPPNFDRLYRERREPARRPDAGERTFADEGGPAATGDSRTPANTPGADAACGTLDILVAYTAAAAAQAGSIDGLVQLALAETNNSYDASAVALRLRLVHSYRTDYLESDDMELDVQRFRDSADGFMDEVHDLRDLHGADVAVLLTGNHSYCGWAADILAMPDTAFAIVAQNCATGNYSFGHEIGHLQGARHDRDHDPLDEPFAYGHGFCAPSTRKRTIMSYDCPPGCLRIDRWSGPHVVIDGVAMGSEQLHHDARVLNETACRLAGFRSLEVPGGGSPLGPGEAASTPGSALSGGEELQRPQPAPALSGWGLVVLIGCAALIAARRPWAPSQANRG